MRNAQVDGGVEWNWSPGRVGHWAGTQEDVFAGTVSTSRGDALRVYAFDRFNHTAFQVDSIILNGTLYAHAKVLNPNPAPVRGYWWTNVAHRLLAPNHPCRAAGANASRSSRVLLPATEQVNTAAGYSLAGWPKFNEHCCPSAGAHYQKYGPAVDQSFGGRDMSYLGNWDRFADVFSRIDVAAQRPFVGLADRDLYGEHRGLIHGHPLNGSKMYVGGSSGGAQAGQRWYMQEYDPASRSHAPDAPDAGSAGCFLELQTGVARTQSQYFPLGANASAEWTEYFRTLRGMPDDGAAGAEALFADDYGEAMGAVNDWLESEQGVPAATFADVDGFMRAVAGMPVTRVLATGTPYGALHERLTGRRLSPAMPFAIADADREEVQPWLDLLSPLPTASSAPPSSSFSGGGSGGGGGGVCTFSAASLDAIPLSFMVHADWVALIRASAAAHGATHLHHLHLGHAAAERRDFARAVAAFNASLAMRPTALAHRNLAVTLDDDGARWEHYQAAWALALADTTRAHAPDLQRNLAMEMGGFLLAKPALASASVCGGFLGGLDAAPGCAAAGPLCGSDQVALLVLGLKQAAGNASDVLAFLEEWRFVTPPQTLASFSGAGLWEKMVCQVAAEVAGRPLSQLERKRAMLARPPPRRLLPL